MGEFQYTLESMNRRKFLATTVSIGGVALIAGCTNAEPDDLNVTSNYQVEGADDGIVVNIEGTVEIVSCNDCYIPNRVEVVNTLLDDTRSVIKEEELIVEGSESETAHWSTSLVITGDDALEQAEGMELETKIDRVWHEGERL